MSNTFSIFELNILTLNIDVTFLSNLLVFVFLEIQIGRFDTREGGRHSKRHWTKVNVSSIFLMKDKEYTLRNISLKGAYGITIQNRRRISKGIQYFAQIREFKMLTKLGEPIYLT